MKSKTESIGKGLPGTKIWIENENKKKIIEPFVSGELVCKGKIFHLGIVNLEKIYLKVTQIKMFYEQVI